MSERKPTNQQHEIIEYDGDLLVTAVPGSGKTKTVIDKVESLTKTIDEKYIFVITYTYRAADEVADRLSSRNIENTNVWSGTIHRFCLEFILNPNSSLVDELSKGYDIVDEDDLENIIRSCHEKLNIRYNPYDKINLSLETDGSYSEINASKRNVVEAVYNHLRQNRKISFDQILYYAYKIISEHQYVSRNIANSTEWIIVDEYQDTKELQYQIIGAIAQKTSSMKLMFVGDPNQAIYTSLGGVMKNKEQLDALMDRNFCAKHLTGCFRSNQRIIDFYNNFACEREEIQSNTVNYVNPYVKYYSDIQVDSDTFGAFAKCYIDSFHGEGVDYSDICVILPWNTHLLGLSSWFLREAPHIPIDSPTITPLKKMDDGIWNNFVRLLFVSINYSNIFYYERLLRTSLREIELRFGVICTDKTEALIDYYLNNFFDNNASATDVIENESNKIFGEYIGLSIDIYAPHINFLIEATKKKIQNNNRTLSDTVGCFKQCYRGKNGVVFSTMHGCKGEEYRCVIVGGLNEYYVPYDGGTKNRAESKRLLYVVMSRAKEKLVISSRSPDPSPRYNRDYAVNYEIDNCNFDFDV